MMNSCSVLILVMHGLQLIFSENWVRWSQKVYPEPKILWVASAWSESKLLRSMIWWIRVATNLFWASFYVRNFHLSKLQNEKFIGDEIFLPKPYAWSRQRDNPLTCCLYHFELPNLVTLLSFLSCSHDRESRTHHFHLLNLLHRKIACPYHPLYHTLFMLHTLLESLPNFSPRKAWAMN